MINNRHIKVLLFLTIISITTGSSILYAQNAIPLDEAIKTGAGEIEAKLKRGDKVIVLNFRSESQRFSDYVLDEMMTELVRNGKVIVVDRANLELIRQEMNFQMSGDVSDSSAQAIGQMLGAQSIISGNIEDLGTYYRIRFRTIEVESAAIQVLSSLNVNKDTQIATLMGGTGAAPVVVQSPAADSDSAQAESPTQYLHGLNFSTGRKVGAGFLNMIFGIGSFTMGDWAGGLIVGGIEVIGVTVYIIGFSKLLTPYPDSYNYPAGYNDPDYIADIKAADDDYDTGVIITFIGIGVYALGDIIGFTRPFSYDKRLAKKNGTYFTAGENPMRNISLTPVHSKSKTGMALTYSVSY